MSSYRFCICVFGGCMTQNSQQLGRLGQAACTGAVHPEFGQLFTEQLYREIKHWS
jgi:hypothetical protein